MSDTPTFTALPDRRNTRLSQESNLSEKHSVPQIDGVDPKPLPQDVKQPTQQPREVKGETDGAQAGPTSTDPDVRYVLSGQPTGWAAMAETVRAYDEEKVKDCKEDVDTLLVFVRHQSSMQHCVEL